MTQKGRKTRITHLRQRREQGQPITMMTAYDTITARWVDEAGIDVALVGDSLGNTALGLGSTIPVRLETMIHHCAAVARGVSRALVVGDLPFMSYKISAEQAMAAAARLMQEGMVEAVKLEGGVEMAATVARLVEAGIPVMGHIGLLPQSVHAQGGYRMQGREEAGAARLLDDARALEEAGAFSLVLEGMPAALGKRITEEIGIPTIGIGAGPDCSGQVLVLADALGMEADEPPSFAKVFMNLREQAVAGLRQYAEEVRQRQFPEGE